MARIRIDDLPIEENLTPEEEELILGAGRRSFRPTFESLENRELTDAALGAAVLPGLLQGEGHAAQVRAWAPASTSPQGQINDPGVDASRLPEVIYQLPENTLPTAQAKQEARLDLNTFCNNVVRQSEILLENRVGSHEKCLIEPIAGGVKVIVYTDHRTFNPRVYIPNKDYGRTKPDSPGRGEVWLIFKYDDAQLARGFLTLSELRQGYHFTNYWNKTFGQGEHHYWEDTGNPWLQSQLRNAQWSTSPDSKSASNAILEKAGDQLGAEVLKLYRGKSAIWGGHNGTSYQSNVDGRITNIVRTANGVRIDVLVERPVEVERGKGDYYIGKRDATICFEYAYEGEINGIHQFKLLDTSDNGSPESAPWMPYLSEELFAVSREQAKELFARVRV